MSNDVNDVLDVAIVGGGVSGVYSAWRLMRDSGPATFGNGGGRPKITVFEGSERIGGRMLSVTPPGMPSTVCELGGMRFMSRHVIVSSLVQYFNLATVPFPVYEADNIAYLRGKVLRLPDLNDPAVIPYNFTDVEKTIVENTATNMLMYALQQIVPNCLGISYDDLCLEVQRATFDGKPLRHFGFWNLLARILSPDAYAFARDTCGYDVIVSNTNAADAILFILSDFGPNVTYSRCVNGYDQIPQRLAAEFQAAGGNVTLGAWLRSFDSATLPDGTNGVSLSFRDGTTVLARNLVLAMPERAIELLDHSGSVLDDSRTEVWDLINSVYPIPMFKIFLAYHYPWWQPIGPTQGRTLTDLPIRQCYYWGVEPASPDAPGNSVLLASYDDENSVSFWAGLRKKSEITEYYEPEPVADAAPGTWGGHKAPREMAEEAHRQIVQMHGVPYAPKPYAASYRDWAEDPYGGGINVWKIHADSWSIAQTILNPRPGIPVYICGEAFSHEQGWVEGALQTAENMVTQYFGLPSHVPPQPVVAPANPLPGSRIGARVK
ncbi:MAG: flavin monoamine oxidase family protein [Gemmatimonadaceae bacterium]